MLAVWLDMGEPDGAGAEGLPEMQESILGRGKAGRDDRTAEEGGEGVTETELDYVKMCDCPEIQGRREDKDYAMGDWRDGDLFASSNATFVYCQDCERDAARPMHSYSREMEDAIWLPTQAQLQRMLPVDEMTDNPVLAWFEPLWMFFKLHHREAIVATWEGLWLALVMMEQHNKRWNGEAWI